MVTDPVCLKELHEHEIAWRAVFRGNLYHFCGKRCLNVFQRDPDEYSGAIPAKVYGDHGPRRRLSLATR